ncbi:MAG: hypothetical protein HRU17_09695 [Polyangiaceae bacterium]|nr:hypothetical protein [Polyangiaceae bacterium]
MAHPTILNRRVGRHRLAQHSFAPRTLLSVRLGGLFLAMGLLLTGCPSRDSVGLRAIGLLGEGVINDPKNKSLRFDILKFGLEQFCTEMGRRGAPLKMRDNDPVMGRFFTQSCQSQIIEGGDQQSFIVRFSGNGHAWTNLSGRIGFEASGLVEYAADFHLQGDAMYIYFRPRNVNAASFHTLMVESKLAQAGMAVTGVSSDQIGHDLLTGQLQRGFTVIRKNSEGEMDFGMGIIAKGRLPFRPFQIRSSDKLVLENDRTEIQVGQQDIIGGFRVKESGQALYLMLTLDGARSVDFFLVDRASGDRMLDQFHRRPGPAQLSSRPPMDELLHAGPAVARFLAVPPGEYYLVIDHSDGAGHSSPRATGNQSPATVDYLVQVGDAP